MIPFADLKAQYHSIKAEIDAAIADVLENSAFILGKHVARFEEEFASFCGAGHAIGVNSGTSALHLALLAAGIGPGDEVITVPFTFVATVAAIGYTGARPVFVDIDPVAYTMNPAAIEAAITSRTKAIMPVHLYGQPADMDPILEIARRHHLTVIEDAAQAHGAEYKGRRVGSIGHIGCFSFYPGKNLGAYGEGGAVVTDNPDFNRTIRMLRDWGCEKRYEHVIKGYNYRLEGMQGAVLSVKLNRLAEWTALRRAHASQYSRLLDGAGVCTPVEMEYAHHVYHVYAIRLVARNALQTHLQLRQIQTGIHYPTPIHLLEAWADLNYKRGDFPVSEQVAGEVLSLPMYAELTLQQIETVASATREISHAD
ncbi:MAG TPA: DegT/DnrJ/EryC1/StrS family aminotransferase [Candidatus Acidoferrales bacterium]|nr:DegT/DnrJ/EryC1/StrS family aminotransferase [Candidatus Acidoferrales bacterium]